MKTLLTIVALLVFALGLLLGRWWAAPAPGYGAVILPGDDALEQSWENFLLSQRAGLALLRDSEFYGDDQERAEAHAALLGDIAAATTVAMQADAEAAAAGNPGTPNGMAARLERAAQRIFARSEARLARLRVAFAAAPNTLTVLPDEADDQIGVAHWRLDNDQALLVHLPAGNPDLALANVWAMSLEARPGERSLPDCSGGSGCLGILSHRDPGRAGWLDTGGRRRGLLMLRWPLLAPDPILELVPFTELDSPVAPGSSDPIETTQE